MAINWSSSLWILKLSTITLLKSFQISLWSIIQDLFWIMSSVGRIVVLVVSWELRIDSAVWVINSPANSLVGLLLSQLILVSIVSFVAFMLIAAFRWLFFRSVAADSAKFRELFVLLTLRSMLSIFILPFEILGMYISVSILLVIEFRWAYIDMFSVVYQGMSRVWSRGFRGSIVSTQVMLFVLLVVFSKFFSIGIDLDAIDIKWLANAEMV